MKPITSFSASTKQASQHTGIVLKVEGRMADAAAATGLFLQVHDNNTTPSAGAVPLKSWPVSGGGGTGIGSEFYKEFKRGDLVLFLGCFVGISSTEATYTASNNNWGTLSVELSDPEIPAAVSYAGDLTTAVTGLQVWTEASGLTSRKSLVALEVDGTNLTTATQFIQLFATDTINTGDKPIVAFPIAVGAVLTGESKLNFGEFGRQIFSIDSDASTKRLGCTVKISSTASTYTAATGTAAIKAEYRTEP